MAEEDFEEDFKEGFIKFWNSAVYFIFDIVSFDISWQDNYYGRLFPFKCN
jgi:hypothetical protein